MPTLLTLQEEIISCEQCPRLIDWRRQVAREKVKRFAHQDYWGKPVPSFGDLGGRLMIVGLAPAAHGANRTGRMFTGDRSGEWLYRALYRSGFANQPTFESCDDGLVLTDCWITAVTHCAPPKNKPSREEIQQCSRYLTTELTAFIQTHGHHGVVLTLGKIAFDEVLRHFSKKYPEAMPSPRPVFFHGACYAFEGLPVLMGSYHPSQQNTFTGRLTESMFDKVFTSIRSRFTMG